jgi:hypothetical protein
MGALEMMEALLHKRCSNLASGTFPPILDKVPVSLVFDNFQEKQWKVGAATLEVFIFGGTPRVSSFDFQGESLRSELHWLCLVVVLLKELF